MTARIRPLLLLALTLAAALPGAARAAGLEMITVGEQTIEGVLVRWQGRYQLLTDAGTKTQKVWEVAVARGKPALASALGELAVEREAVPLVGKQKMVKKGALFVPTTEAPENPYAPELTRKFFGVVDAHARFEIQKLLPKKTGPEFEKLLAAAIERAREVVNQEEQPQLDMALTVLERTGTLEKILRDIAPMLAEGAR